jgi:oligopeptide transport system substrate-binding protein
MPNYYRYKIRNAIIRYVLIISLFLPLNSNSYGQTLERGFGWPLDAELLDPHQRSSDTIYAAIKHFLATPLTLDKHKVLGPGLVEKWKINQNGDVITLSLRPDAVWSDGVKITAETLSYSLKRALLPQYSSDAKPLLLQIKNSVHWVNGDTSKSLGLDVVDTHTLDITLESPSPLFLYSLAHPIASPVPMHQLGALDDNSSIENISVLVSSGPYKLISSDESSIKFERNENYFGESPFYKEVNFKFAHYKELIGLYLAGELDILDWIDNKQYEWIKQNKPDDAFFAEEQVPTYIVIGQITGDVKTDLQIRKAIFAVLDKQSTDKLLSERGLDSSWGVIPWHNKSHTKLILPEDYLISKDQAADIMDDLGYAKENPLEVCMTSYSNNPDRLINYMKSNLASINIMLTVVHEDSFGSHEKDCQIGFGSYASRIHSEEEVIDIFFENGMFRKFMLKDEDVQQRYMRLKQVASLQERLTVVSEIEKKLYEHYHVMNLQNAPMLSLVKPEIKGYRKAFRSTIIGLSQHLSE